MSSRILSPEYRLWFYKALLASPKQKKCNIFLPDNTLQVTAVKPRTSSSIAIVGFGNVTVTASDSRQYSKDVAVKISTYDDKDPYGLFYEIWMYSTFSNRIIEQMFSPHITAFMAYIPCQAFYDNICKATTSIGQEMKSQLESTIQVKCNSSIVQDYYANILITEKVNGGSMYDELVLKKRHDSWPAIAQVLYTLLVFDQFKFSHNDLHIGNIFVEKIPTVEKFIYFISPDEYFVLDTNYMSKIYDFDRSYAEKRDEYGVDYPAMNNILQLPQSFKELPSGVLTSVCEYLGTCNKYDTYFDLYRFIAQLHHYALVNDTFWNAFILDDKYRDRTTMKHPFYLCENIRDPTGTYDICNSTATFDNKFLNRDQTLTLFLASNGTPIQRLSVDGFDPAYKTHPLIYMLPSINRNDVLLRLASESYTHIDFLMKAVPPPPIQIVSTIDAKEPLKPEPAQYIYQEMRN
jgi:hypothetical protein